MGSVADMGVHLLSKTVGAFIQILYSLVRQSNDQIEHLTSRLDAFSRQRSAMLAMRIAQLRPPTRLAKKSSSRDDCNGISVLSVQVSLAGIIAGDE